MKDGAQNSMDEQNRLDLLLDSALASYTPADARPGLADRVQARMDAAVSSPPEGYSFPWRWVWVAAAVLAVLVLIAVMRFPARSTRDLPATARTVPAHPVPPVEAVPRAVGAHNTMKSHAEPRRDLAKEQEALPRGPSQEELIAKVMASSPQAFALMAESQSAVGDAPEKPIEIRPLPDDPIVIAPIAIKPLDDSSAATGGRF